MLKIVIVDSSIIVRQSISLFLTQMGHQIVGEAKNGLEAVQSYKKHAPHLITLDITIPELDGIAVLKEIRKINPSAKVIMITSHSQEEMVISAVRSGASGYILKPITQEKLSKALSKVFPEMKIASRRRVPSQSDTYEGDLIDLETGCMMNGEDDNPNVNDD